MWEKICRTAGLVQSVPLIKAPGVWLKGFTGKGLAIAVLDSGVDGNHEMLKGKIVSEACFGTNAPAAQIRVACPRKASSSYAVGSGTNCPKDIALCLHGTHVAAIAAGKNTDPDAGEPRFGVANGANIIAVQVFSKSSKATDCDPSPTPCARTPQTDQLRGLERVFNLRSR